MALDLSTVQYILEDTGVMLSKFEGKFIVKQHNNLFK